MRTVNPWNSVWLRRRFRNHRFWFPPRDAYVTSYANIFQNSELWYCTLVRVLFMYYTIKVLFMYSKLSRDLADRVVRLELLHLPLLAVAHVERHGRRVRNHSQRVPRRVVHEREFQLAALGVEREFMLHTEGTHKNSEYEYVSIQLYSYPTPNDFQYTTIRNFSFTTTVYSYYTSMLANIRTLFSLVRSILVLLY